MVLFNNIMHMESVKSNRLLQQVRTFFKKYFAPGKPLLLGYSGGYDSELLLHLLTLLKKEFAFDLHLAHVDHGWREESREEAEHLRKKAEGLGYPFHCKRLEKKTGEEEARSLRFAYFKTLFARFEYQAVLLAHQKNDLAETVFKRFLEGAHLPFLYGMEERKEMEGLILWRPLLSISKKEIMEFLRENRLAAIDDPSNRKSSFLRARMREELLPYVEKSFGKSVLHNMAEASVRSSELKNYLDKKTQNAWEKIIQGPLGYLVPKNAFSSLERVEQEHLFKRISQEKRINVPRDLLTQLLLRQEEKSFRFVTKGALFIWERDNLFIQTRPFPPWKRELLLQEGVWEEEEWRLAVTKVEKKKKDQNSGFDVWKNEMVLYLPIEKYRLMCAQAKDRCVGGTCLKKWWQTHKTFAFMRPHLPVVYLKGQVVGEFLSGKSLSDRSLGVFPTHVACWRIALEIMPSIHKELGKSNFQASGHI